MGADNIKYRYAADGDKILDILTGPVTRGKDYTCLSCDGALRPVMGEERQHHFRHKIQTKCSTETYLHNLAKRVFVQTYQECLLKSQPYTIKYQVPVRCSACKTSGPCREGHQLRAIDLTKYFKKIDVEAQDNDFIPDILLTSGANFLYVEIAVTHFLEEKKANAGTRIIEIHIDEENDIDLIKSCCLSEEDPRIGIINFRKTPVDANLAGQCTKSIDAFVIYPNGNCKFCSIPVPEFERLSSEGIYIERVDRLGRQAPEEELTKRIERALSKDVLVRNCWICEFHCLRNQTYESYCRLKKQLVVNNNQAVTCKRFSPISKLPDCGLLVDARRRLITRPPLVKTARCVFCGRVYTENSGGWWWFNAEKSECKCNKCEKQGFS